MSLTRLRRSMLFVPGNNPGMVRDAYIYGSDSIMFDLEDSVSAAEKDAARFLVFNALKSINYGNKELVVRINDLKSGLGILDLEAIVRAQPHVIRLPKTETAEDVLACEREIARIEAEIPYARLNGHRSDRLPGNVFFLDQRCLLHHLPRITEKFRPFRRQQNAAGFAHENTRRRLFLQFPDRRRQAGLGNEQRFCRLGDASLFGDLDHVFELLERHTFSSLINLLRRGSAPPRCIIAQ